MESFSDQLRQVLRRLGRAPVFTIITVITLAAGVGANIAVFSVVEGVLLKPLPYPHAETLVAVQHTAPGFNMDAVGMAPSNYFIYREQNHVFEDIGLYMRDSVALTGQGSPEQVRALDVTDGILPILGVPPTLGRWFSRADDTPGSADTVMLDYGYWQRRFGGDRTIVGRTITVDGKPRQVIGVMARNFRFLDVEQPALFLPLQFDRSKTTLGDFSYEGIARLRPGVTLTEVNTEIQHLIPTVWSSFAAPPGFSLDLFQKARLGAKVMPLTQDVVGDVGTLLWVLMGSIGVVLLIACANVANLLLVRAEGRHQELAIRAALGASRWRIASDFLLESVVIGILGQRPRPAAGMGSSARADCDRSAGSAAAAGHRHRPYSARIYIGCVAVLQSSVRLHTGDALRQRTHGYWPAGGGPHAQPGTRTASHPQYAGGHPGEFGVCAAHRLGIDDPHLPRVDPRRSGIR